MSFRRKWTFKPIRSNITTFGEILGRQKHSITPIKGGKADKSRNAWTTTSVFETTRLVDVIYNSNMRSTLYAKFGIIFIELVVVACIFFTKVPSQRLRYFASHSVRKPSCQQFSEHVMGQHEQVHRHLRRSFNRHDRSAASVFVAGSALRRPVSAFTYGCDE